MGYHVMAAGGPKAAASAAGSSGPYVRALRKKLRDIERLEALQQRLHQEQQEQDRNAASSKNKTSRADRAKNKRNASEAFSSDGLVSGKPKGLDERQLGKVARKAEILQLLAEATGNATCRGAATPLTGASSRQGAISAGGRGSAAVATLHAKGQSKSEAEKVEWAWKLGRERNAGRAAVKWWWDDGDHAHARPLTSSAATDGSLAVPGGIISPKHESVYLKPAPAAWEELALHPAIGVALSALGFERPTPIQNESIRAGMWEQRDVVGIAETGAGKTLAYGIPIIHNLLVARDLARVAREARRAAAAATPTVAASAVKGPVGCADISRDESAALNEVSLEADGVRPLHALIVCPTRELVIQVVDNLNAILAYGGSKALRAVAVVGGMSEEKQRRLLGYRPPIVVGTPGRLWELYSDGEPAIREGLATVRFVVLDEADRLVESGHFKELRDLLRCLPWPRRWTPPPSARRAGRRRQGSRLLMELDDESAVKSAAGATSRESQNKGDLKAAAADEGALVPVRQAFLFSATIEVKQPTDIVKKKSVLPLPEGKSSRDKHERKDSDSNEDSGNSDTDKGDDDASTQETRRAKPPPAKRRRGERGADAREEQQKKKASVVNVVKLARRLLRTAARPKVVDVSGHKAVAGRVRQILVKCPAEDKELYLAFYLTQNPGRALVFVNAVSGARRLAAVLAAAGLPAKALHAGMQQRARLRAVDRFKATAGSVLVATDVAARGLDIPAVEHVLHFDLPHTADAYTHRSGRAAHRPGEAPTLSSGSNTTDDTGRGYSVLLVDPRGQKELDKAAALTHRFKGVTRIRSHSRLYSNDLIRAVRAARRTVQLETVIRRSAADRSWRGAAAAALELDDDDHATGGDGDADDGDETGKGGEEARKAKALEAELRDLHGRLSDSPLCRPNRHRFAQAAAANAAAAVGGTASRREERGRPLAPTVTTRTAAKELPVIGGRAQLDAITAGRRRMASGATKENRRLSPGRKVRRPTKP